MRVELASFDVSFGSTPRRVPSGQVFFRVSPARAERRQEQDDQRATQGAEIVSHTVLSVEKYMCL